MTDWYAEFQRELAKTGGRAQKSQSSSLAMVAPTVDTSTYGKELNGFKDHIGDLGGRFLDVISRPGYATGNFLNTILENRLGKPTQTSNPFNAALKGITGEQKDFFKPVSILAPHKDDESWVDTAGRWVGDFGASLISDPTTYIGAGAVSKVGKATGLSKIGDKVKEAAQSKNGLTSLDAEAERAGDLAYDVGKLKETGLFEKSKTHSVPDVVPDEILNNGVPKMGANKTFIDNMPTLSVNDTKGLSGQALIDELIKTAGKKQSVVGALDSPAAKMGADQILNKGMSPTKVKTGKPEDDLAMLTIVRAHIAQNLREVRGKLFKKGELDSPWEDRLVTEGVKRPDVQTFDEIMPPAGKTIPGETIPGMEIGAQANRDAAIRYLWDNAPDLDNARAAKAASRGKQYAAHESDIYFDGKLLGSDGLNTLKAHADANIDFSKVAKDINGEIVGIDVPNIPNGLTYGQYASALKQGVEKPFFDGGSLGVGPEQMGLNDYIKSRNAQYKERSVARQGESTTVPPTPEEMAAYEKSVSDQASAKSAYDAQVAEADSFVPRFESIRPDTQSRREWMQKHESKLTAKDKARLGEALRRGSQDRFQKIADDIMDREGSLDINVIDEFNQAVKDGRISKEVAQEMYAKFDAKTPAQAKNRIAQIDGRIERVKKSLSGKIEEVGPDAADNAMPKSKAAAIRMAKANPIPAPKVPQKFFKTKFDFKRDKFDQSSTKQFVDAMEGVVDPVALGKLTPANMNFLMKTLGRMLDSNRVFNVKNLKGSLTNVQKTHNNVEDVYTTLREINTETQYSIWKELLGQVRPTIPQGMKGPGVRGAYLYDSSMPVLKALDDMMRAYGIHPSLTAGGKGLPLSLHDILSSIPRADAQKFFFDKAAEIKPSQWAAIGEEAFYATIKNIDDSRDTVKLLLEGGEDEALGFAANAVYNGRQAGKNRAAKQAKEGKIGENFDKEVVYRTEGVRQRTIDKNIEHLFTPEFVRKIKDTVSYNSARAEIQAGEFVSRTTNEMVQAFANDIAAIRNQDELFSLVENSTKGVKGFVRSADDIVAPPGAVEEITDQMRLVSRGNPGTEIALKEKNANANIKMLEDTKTSGQALAKANNSRIEEMIGGYELRGNPEFSTFGTAMYHMFPHLSQDKFRHLLLSSENVQQVYSKGYTQQLSKFEAEIGRETSEQVWSDMAKGIGPSESMAPVHARMQQFIDETFKTMERAGVDPAQFESNRNLFKLNYGLNGSTPAEAFSSWKQWGDIKDPLNVLSRAHAVAQKSLREKELFDNLSMEFGSSVQKEGYVRLFNVRGGSRVAHLIDTRKYYPESIARNIDALDKTMAEMAKGASHNELLKVLDEATHRLKSGLTIYRPGHHMRNAFGDAWLNMMVGVKPGAYKKAWGVMATRADHYDPEMLKQIDLESFKPNGRIVTSINVNGKKVDIDENMMYILMRDSGGLPTYQALEDLGSAGTYGQPDKVIEGKPRLSAPTGGRAHKVASTVSEVRDHYFRAAQFIHEMEQTKSLKVKPRPGESVKDATNRALLEKSMDVTANVRKWHPDGTDLQRFERNGLKRGILFYSWIRKMIPLVMEASIMRPGRTLAYPKATYTFAEANGIDLNGMSDPFPSDQLFPNWMGGTQGPQFGAPGSYLGIRPGNPMMDIYDQYFANPGEAYQTILSATHPLIKIPYELATGSTTQGVPVNDLSKYAMGQVPFGSLVNTLIGKPIGGVSKSDANYDPGGIRDPKSIALINAITGVGLLDMGKPSYQKTAEFDQKYGRTGETG